MASIYNAQSIKILKGLAAVRKRPGMYIGSTDSRGLHHLVWEILDNAIDEALAGFCNEISIVIHKNNEISIEDNGRGIPVGQHESGKSTPEVVFTELHAGGKFDANVYKTAGGLHGVGASVTNALSQSLIATIYKNKKIYEISFISGGQLDQPLTEIGTTNKKGTKVTFIPDSTIFANTEFNYTKIVTKVKQKAYLINNLKINLTDELIGKSESFKFENGLFDYLKELNINNTPLHKPLLFRGKLNDINLNLGFQYTDSDHERILSFVNNVRTMDGGSHEVGFKNAFTKTFNDFIKKYKLNKHKFIGEDIREGITVIISIYIPEMILEFEGQTKSKLGTPSARSIVENIVSEKLNSFLEENRDIALKLITKMTDSFVIRETIKKARLEAKKTKNKLRNEGNLIGKLTPAQSKIKEKNEIYLVEGDSAGGSAKQGRDRKHQAILPLKGKVINAEKNVLHKVLQNDEIRMIISALGTGVGKEFNLANLKYGKVIIMTDADTDGAHIQCLILTFFYRFMQPLITANKVFVAMPPLYKISTKKTINYVWSEQELINIKKNIGENYTIQRYKGLGEMNPDQLWETTMNPIKRKLIKISIEDTITAEQIVTTLMGNNVNIRRNWIQENVKFSLENNFNQGKEINYE